MFGVLYVNFSLLWKPVCGNIVALADVMEGKMFWTEYVGMLESLMTGHAQNSELTSLVANQSRVL